MRLFVTTTLDQIGQDLGTDFLIQGCGERMVMISAAGGGVHNPVFKKGVFLKTACFTDRKS